MQPKPIIITVAILLSLGACKDEKISLGVHCESNISDTVDFSSALAYGVGISPPDVQGVKSFDEVDLMEITIRSGSKFGLLANDGNGQFYSEPCDGELCGVEDAKNILTECRSEPQCKIVGAYKNNTLYPLYLSDDQGGHICSNGIR